MTSAWSGGRPSPTIVLRHRCTLRPSTPAPIPNTLQIYNPGLREAIKSYSAWPTIPQVGCV